MLGKEVRTGVEEEEEGENTTVKLAFDAEAICRVELALVVDTGHAREGERDIESIVVCENDEVVMLELVLVCALFD
jgi:hypothetical protein